MIILSPGCGWTPVASSCALLEYSPLHCPFQILCHNPTYIRWTFLTLWWTATWRSAKRKPQVGGKHLPLTSGASTILPFLFVHTPTGVLPESLGWADSLISPWESPSAVVVRNHLTLNGKDRIPGSISWRSSLQEGRFPPCGDNSPPLCPKDPILSTSGIAQN